MLREAIACGLDHRAEALDYALQFGRGIDAAVADRFVRMYVNDLTQDYGDEGRAAVAELLRRGEAIGALPGPVYRRLDRHDAQRLSVSAAPAASITIPSDARPVERDALEPEPAEAVDHRRGDELAGDEQPDHGRRPDPRDDERDREDDERPRAPPRQHPLRRRPASRRDRRAPSAR